MLSEMDTVERRFLEQKISVSCTFYIVFGALLFDATAVSTGGSVLSQSNVTKSSLDVISNSSISTNVFIDLSFSTPSIQSTTEPVTEILTDVTTLPSSSEESFDSLSPSKREQESIIKALEWLKLKRAPDYGWGNNTHMVILAKELSGTKQLLDVDENLQTIQDLENILSIKEMEIEILAMLDRHHSLPKPLNLEKLARFVLSLGSLCKDPKHFYKHDLVAILQHHEPTQDIDFALSTLSACSSAAHVRKRQIRRLLDIASGVTDQSVDTIAMVRIRC